MCFSVFESSVTLGSWFDCLEVIPELRQHLLILHQVVHEQPAFGVSEGDPVAEPHVVGDELAHRYPVHASLSFGQFVESPQVDSSQVAWTGDLSRLAIGSKPLDDA